MGTLYILSTCSDIFITFGNFENICSVTFVLCPRSQQFEVQQAALHQQLLALQMELTATKQLYDSLLEQVSQQNGFIQQLSELPEAPKSEDTVTSREPETTETLSECRFGRGPAAFLI